MKKIAVFTSGGDAPGMNACIRAVVRATINKGMEAVGIYRGYQGIIDADFQAMDAHSVSNILHLGGTMLRSARCEDFRTVEGRKRAYENLKKEGKTIVMVHHDLQTVDKYFDWVVMLNRSLVATGPINEVFTKENLDRAYQEKQRVSLG